MLNIPVEKSISKVFAGNVWMVKLTRFWTIKTALSLITDKELDPATRIVYVPSEVGIYGMLSGIKKLLAEISIKNKILNIDEST